MHAPCTGKALVSRTTSPIQDATIWSARSTATSPIGRFPPKAAAFSALFLSAAGRSALARYSNAKQVAVAPDLGGAVTAVETDFKSEKGAEGGSASTPT